MLVLAMLIGCLCAPSYGQEKGVSDYNVPPEVAACMKMLGTRYRLSGDINPFYLRGSFYGEPGLGYAVLIARDHERGIMFCRSGASVDVLGAGTAFHGMKNLSFGAWQVHPKSRQVKRGAGERTPPTLLADALLLEWEESASGLVYWNGKRFIWYQQGD